MLCTAINFFNSNILSINFLECVSMNYQECKIRTEIIDVNTNEPMFYPFFNCAKAVLIQSMTRMLNYALLILIKT